MEEKQRKGTERRQNIIAVYNDRRSGKERRSLMDQQLVYISILKKIPTFLGLTLDQSKKIIRICSKQQFSVGEFVCRTDEESHKMFILIKGKLTVLTHDDKKLAYISPVETVGEMGVFTGKKRSASVKVAEESIMLVIHKVELFSLFKNESELGIKVLINVIEDMANKLRKNNEIIENMRQMCPPGLFSTIISRS